MTHPSSKVAIVTGAGSGIGAATAKRFAKEGYKVVLNGRTESKLQTVANEIGADHCFSTLAMCLKRRMSRP
jgi:meso-butanediol dehydrogenase/(S,S)-butanediol dehydrogenase/diacetyl reductase